jgi:hypothetical protein
MQRRICFKGAILLVTPRNYIGYSLPEKLIIEDAPITRYQMSDEDRLRIFGSEKTVDGGGSMNDTESHVITKNYYLSLRVKGIKRRDIFNNLFGGKVVAFHAFLKDYGLFEVEEEDKLVTELLNKAKVSKEIVVESNVAIETNQASSKSIKEVVEVGRKNGNPNITKELLDSEFSKGKNVSQIERDNGMSLGTLRSKMKTMKYTIPSSKEMAKLSIKSDPVFIPSNESQNEVESHLQGAADKVEQTEPVIEAADPIDTPDEVAIETTQECEVIEQATAEEIVLESKPEEIQKTGPSPSGAVRRYIVLRIPLIDVGATRIDQRMNMLEDMNELLTEVELKHIDYPTVAKEMFESFQSIAGLVYSEMQGLISPENVENELIRFFQRHNDSHIERMDRIAIERGWKVSGL